jgi:hypothetical protein
MSKLCFVLGAPDPEMQEIERIARSVGAAVGYATHHGERVRPETAYQADEVKGFDLAAACHCGGEIVAVECGPSEGCTDWGWICTGLVPGAESEVDCAAFVRRVDHHRPGDPGYGRPPSEYLSGSSLGQVLALLGLEPTPEQRFIAAADHCLSAAYRGECPGVDPDELMRCRAASRAAFQKRELSAVLADIERARAAIRDAEWIALATTDKFGCCRGCGNKVMATDDDPSWDYCVCPRARDMREYGQLRELPEASARENECIVAEGLPLRDGRRKIVCQSGSPDQIRAFMEIWGPAQGLRDIYGDPARGFAGGYLPA